MLVGNDSHATILAVAWTLYHEVAFYLVFGVFVAAPRLGTILAAAWLAMVVASGIGATLTPLYLSRPISLLFPMGIVAWRVSRDLPARGLKSVTWLTGFGFVAIGVAEVFGPALGEDALHLLYGMASAVGIAAISACERRRPIAVPRVLLTLGAASYSIYLTHYPVLGALAQGIVRLGLRDALPVPLMFALIVAVTLAIGVGFHHLVERPLLRALRNTRLGDRRVTPRRASPASARAT